jgi:hypothetical protein
MAMVSTSKASAGADSGQAGGRSPTDLRDLRLFVFALFFIFGGITSLNDVIIPKLKGLFTLSYAEVMLVQSAFFAAYFLISLPAAAIVRRVGYHAYRGDWAAADDGRLPACSSLPPRPGCSVCFSPRCSCWRPASPSFRWSPIR